MTVFPRTTVSQTIYSEELRPAEFSFLEPDPVASEKLYQEWLVKKLTKKVKFDPCSCVSYAKSVTGYSTSVGAAKNWPITSQWPTVGAVVVLSESWAGHVAVVRAVKDNTIVIDETNYIPCQKGAREIEIDSPEIKGYWNL